MSGSRVNIGCGGAVSLLILLLIVAGAIDYAARHMDSITSFIVGTIVTILVVLLIISYSRK